MNHQLTPEEQQKNEFLLGKLLQATEANNKEEEKFYRSQVYHDPDALMAIKRTMGAKWIIEHNLNTTLADRKFGHDWLDK